MLHVCGLLKREIRLPFLRNICLSRYKCKTHYEVLQLPRNCSQKDIKNAFIKLSKQYHPDRNVNASTHNNFVKLNEAYSVLSRPETRKEYDLGLVPPDFAVRMSRRTGYGADFTSEEFKPFRDTSFWENRDRSKDAENMRRPYYGVKGLKKVSNSWVLSALIVFTIFGVGLQVLLIRKSVAFSRKTLDEESTRNADLYRQLRATAMAENNDYAVLERLQKNSDTIRASRNKADSAQK